MDIIRWVADDDEHIRCLLSLDAFCVFLCEKPRLLFLKQLGRYPQVRSLQRVDTSPSLKEFVFNVEARYVVGQE